MKLKSRWRCRGNVDVNVVWEKEDVGETSRQKMRLKCGRTTNNIRKDRKSVV